MMIIGHEHFIEIINRLFIIILWCLIYTNNYDNKAIAGLLTADKPDYLEKHSLYHTHLLCSSLWALSCRPSGARPAPREELDVS